MPLHDDIDPPLARLIEAHPLLFKGQAPRVASHLPAGWYGLVDRMCTSIEQLLGPQRAEAFEICQIKEKFGTLRFYYRLDEVGDTVVDPQTPQRRQRVVLAAQPASDEREQLRGLIGRAEEASAQTCAKCGEQGRLLSLGGWMVVVCEADRVRQESV